jgi:hypothetical protein
MENISVTAGNSCGTSTSALPVTVSPATPATPGLINRNCYTMSALTGKHTV